MSNTREKETQKAVLASIQAEFKRRWPVWTVNAIAAVGLFIVGIVIGNARQFIDLPGAAKALAEQSTVLKANLEKQELQIQALSNKIETVLAEQRGQTAALNTLNEVLKNLGVIK